MANTFETFVALHVPGDPVVLYNIWDVGSAHAVVAAGRQGTRHWQPSGRRRQRARPDGQQVPIDFALANARRITEAVESR